MNVADNLRISREPGNFAVHPAKFIVWLVIVSVVMLFAALTSAYIVRQGEGNWIEFPLPPVFWLSTGIILASSAALHLAYQSARKDKILLLQIFLAVTILLGFLFLALQYVSWIYLVNHDVFFVGNPSGSFLYVLTGLHGLHLVSGIIYSGIILVSAFGNKIHSRSLLSLEMCMTYWHFLGGLWVYLFFFLKIYH